MNAIKAIWKNGQIVPAESVNWPDGCELVVEPQLTASPRISFDESEWSDDPPSLADGERSAQLSQQEDDPESVVAWIRWYDSLEPLIYSPGEEAEIEATRQQVREYTRQCMDRGIENVFE